MGVKSHGLVLTRVAMWDTIYDFASVNQSQQQQLKPTNFLPLPKQDDVVWGITNCHLVVVDIHNLTEVNQATHRIDTELSTGEGLLE